VGVLPRPTYSDRSARDLLRRLTIAFIRFHGNGDAQSLRKAARQPSARLRLTPLDAHSAGTRRLGTGFAASERACHNFLQVILTVAAIVCGENRKLRHCHRCGFRFQPTVCENQY